MADPVVHITNGLPDSGTGNITTLGQTLVDGANATLGVTTGAAVVTDATGTLQQYLRGLVKLIAAGISVTVSNTTLAVTQSGSWVIAAGSALIGVVKVGDGTNSAAIKAASTAPVATDPALVVAISPNSVNANGQAVMASSAPVTLANNQSTISVALDTTQISDGATGTMVTPAKAKISIASATTTTLVALSAGKKVRVLSMYLVSAAANTVTLQSHTTTTNADGGCSYAANGGISLPFNPVGWFDSTSGEALDMVTSGAGQVSGQITYAYV